MPLIQISEELYERLSALAAERGIDSTDLIRLLMERAISGSRGSCKTSKNTALARFLQILSEVSEKYPNEFHSIATVAGRSRTYFSKEPDQIEASGSGNKPVLIPGTDWWVTSNTSTETKIKIIQRVFTQVGCTTQERERWLAAFMEGEKFAFSSMPDPAFEAEEDPFRI